MGDFKRGNLAERDIEQASSANVVMVRLNLEVRKVIRAAKSDSRLENNHLPSDIQKLRYRGCYEALCFPPKIEAMGERMRSYGRYIALHLRYEQDMLTFSGCTHGLSPEEADIDKRTKRYCPLTPKEVGMFLSSLRYPSNTPIYITVGEIYGGESPIAYLQSRYPILMSKEKLASDEELTPFANHASQMAALDYIVSVENDVFILTHLGNMARAVEGHRRYLGHRKTISPDRKLVKGLSSSIVQSFRWPSAATGDGDASSV
ncbi:O-fucosyltransferase 7-like [Silene latifolia]|uniref:O-fucosyltransferase 7-like n=1 Tax=Silene latifolia TaxID=37657 RepID=UPI003D781858